MSYAPGPMNYEILAYVSKSLETLPCEYVLALSENFARCFGGFMTAAAIKKDSIIFP